MRRIDQTAWEPYVSTPDDPWDRRKVAHLHRRAGFGATRDELARDVAAGPVESVKRFLDPPDASEDERSVWEGLRGGAIAAGDPRRLRAYWLYRMLFGGDPLRERLTLFWHGHFATSLTKVDSATALARQVETLRERSFGNFAGMLEAIIADPAMLVWLDGGTSHREKPNENFAREFLELFTMGPGAYSERDVREAARAFTGWVPDGGRRNAFDSNPGFTFDEEAHDPGSKTFLGQTGDWNSVDIVRIVLARPETARHLAGKLYRAFVAEEPEPTSEVIESLADVLRSSDYSIQHTMRVILSSRHFYSRACYRRRIKSPAEYTVGLLRTLEVPRSNVSLMAAATACVRQGQELYAPPSVKGWDGGKSWINSSTLLERLNWATDVVWGNPDRGMLPLDTTAWLDGHGVQPAEAGAAFISLLLQDDLAPESRALVLAAAHDPSGNGPGKALQRVLHCPEFQLA
jgi:uncharacterized protein (DUF1800 family)